MGRVAMVLFAHRVGTALEPECKMYRFSADVLNDIAIVLECVCPALPRPGRALLYGLSGVVRALCHVTACSSKASIAAHFAHSGNFGELNAVSGTRWVGRDEWDELSGTVECSILATLGSHVHAQLVH